MHTFAQDVRYGFRQLMRSPGYAVVAIATLALGIGANTAMYTVVENVLLRPLPYIDSGRLVSIGPSGAQGFVSTSWLNYQDIRNQSRTLADAAVYSEDVGVVQTRQGSVSVVTPGVSSNLLQMLGSEAITGKNVHSS
jgi:hypothetical protein